VTAGSGPPGHLGRLARGGIIGFAGSVVNGLAALMVVILVARGSSDDAAAGTVFVAMAVFNIAFRVAGLGSEVGLVRSLASVERTRWRERVVMTTAVTRTLVAGTVLAAGIAVGRSPLARLLGGGADLGDLTLTLVAIAPFIPVAAVAVLVFARTRAHETMVPTVVLDRIVRPAAQVLLLGGAAATGAGPAGLTVAWAVPYALVLPPAIMWSRRMSSPEGSATGDAAALRADYWRFTAPHAVTTALQVLLRWADILLVAALVDPASAAVYTAATRLLLAGNFLNLAVVQAISPMVGRELSAGRTSRAAELFGTGTAWLVTVTWPYYLLVIGFSSTLMGVFGASYSDGATVLVILASAMLVAAAVGPVEAVLLMAGGSRLSLLDNAAALVLQLGLDLVLVPRWGIAGAATSWALSLLITNLAPLAQVKRLLGIHPFGPGHLRAAGLALVLVGLPSIAVGVTTDPAPPAAVGVGALTMVVYLAAMGTQARLLHLDELVTALRPGRSRDRAQSPDPTSSASRSGVPPITDDEAKSR